MSTSPNCPFCAIANGDQQDRVIKSNNHAFTIRDGYPISNGHTLIIPKRHISSFFDTTDQERQSLLSLLDSAKQSLEKELSPQAYNIGINDGAAAGQTVGHLHIHLIPRYDGDVEDPRGGVRWVVPEKADYWSER